MSEAQPCLLTAWRQHEAELHGWLVRHVPDTATVQGALQEVFLKALRQRSAFCRVVNTRAWLFSVTRNVVNDQYRRDQPVEALSDEQLDELAQPIDAPQVIDQLTDCLYRVLGELDAADADVIRECDLNGMRQQDYAQSHGLTLSATKARLRRARERLRVAMVQVCQIQTLPSGGVADFV